MMSPCRCECICSHSHCVGQKWASAPWKTRSCRLWTIRVKPPTKHGFSRPLSWSTHTHRYIRHCPKWNKAVLAGLTPYWCGEHNERCISEVPAPPFDTIRGQVARAMHTGQATEVMMDACAKKWIWDWFFYFYLIKKKFKDLSQFT